MEILDSPPRFLADESCDFAVIRALRLSGFDVIAVVEYAPGARDEDVIKIARDDARVLLTEDRDFGRLVFAAAHATTGVIYIRFPAQRRIELPSHIVNFVQTHAARLSRTFAVVAPDRTRLTTLPH